MQVSETMVSLGAFSSSVKTAVGQDDPYLNDLYIYECSKEIESRLGDQAQQWYKNTALMMFKPDAIVGRRGQKILAFCKEHGFRVKNSELVELNRHSMREIWRYDWQSFPIERLSFSTLWYTVSKTVVILFEQDDSFSQPASERLNDLKGGPRYPEQTSSLRSTLNPPNVLLNFVHVADHPIDVVREIGILFDEFSRGTFIEGRGSASQHDAAAKLDEHINTLEAMYPAHDLSFENSLTRLEHAGLIEHQKAENLREMKNRQLNISLTEMHATLDMANVPALHTWDVIASLSYVIAPQIK
ncbi:MAG: hypothetical protein WA790_19975 [Sulfitobacter sp.]